MQWHIAYDRAKSKALEVQSNEIAYQFVTFYQVGLFSSIYLLRGWVIFKYQKIAFSVDTQQLKNDFFFNHWTM